MNKSQIKVITAFLIIGLVMALTAVSYAVDKCPLNLENDPYPGKCRLYIDADNDKICDLSQKESAIQPPSEETIPSKSPQTSETTSNSSKEQYQEQKTEPVPDKKAEQSPLVKEKDAPVQLSSSPVQKNKSDNISSGTIKKGDNTEANANPAATAEIIQKSEAEDMPGSSLAEQKQNSIESLNPPKNTSAVENSGSTVQTVAPKNIEAAAQTESSSEVLKDEKDSFVKKYFSSQFSIRNLITLILLSLAAIILFIQFRWKHSKWLRYSLLAFSVIYLGFITKGCPSPVGSIQQIPIFYSEIVKGNALDWIVVFITPIVFTIFFGRIFCGAVCPFGALQEFIHKIGALLKLNGSIGNKADIVLKNFRYVTLLGLIFLSVVTGTAWFCKFDPFASVFSFQWSLISIIAAAILLLVSFVFSRPFCRYVCPYGILLGLVSKLVLVFKMKNLNKWCKKCTICQKNCPVGAVQKGVINEAECIRCGECVEKCPVIPIGESNKKPVKEGAVTLSN